MVNFWGWTKPFTDAVDTIGDAAKQGVRHFDDQVLKPLEAVARDFGNAVDDITNKAAGLVGLGKKPNAIPPGPARYDDAPRKVILGWHPVGGVGGQVFEKIIAPLDSVAMVANLANAPNPTHHWAVLVGDYIHELNADTKLYVVYQNYKFNAGEMWYSKEIGTTRYNDEALRLAGEQAIAKMAGIYNIVNNNCQKFALGMVDLILEGQRQKFVTSYSPSAVMEAPEFKLRPVVHVFATEETVNEIMEAAKEKEKAEADAEGSAPATVLCKLFPSMEEAEAAKKADDAEKAAKAEEAARVAAEAAKAAVGKVEEISVNEVTIVGEVAPDTGHVEQIDLVKQLMEEETPVLTV